MKTFKQFLTEAKKPVPRGLTNVQSIKQVKSLAKLLGVKTPKMSKKVNEDAAANRRSVDAQKVVRDTNDEMAKRVFQSWTGT